eukprot:3777822-Alexandrium_andersonii.AAC.1
MHERLQGALCVGHDAHCAPRAAVHPEHDRQEDGVSLPCGLVFWAADDCAKGCSLPRRPRDSKEL